MYMAKGKNRIVIRASHTLGLFTPKQVLFRTLQRGGTVWMWIWTVCTCGKFLSAAQCPRRPEGLSYKTTLVVNEAYQSPEYLPRAAKGCKSQTFTLPSRQDEVRCRKHVELVQDLTNYGSENDRFLQAQINLCSKYTSHHNISFCCKLCYSSVRKVYWNEPQISLKSS